MRPIFHRLIVATREAVLQRYSVGRYVSARLRVKE
jgi:hypothetical protein